MTKTIWCVIQMTKTKTKSEFAVKINTTPKWIHGPKADMLLIASIHCLFKKQNHGHTLVDTQEAKLQRSLDGALFR